MDPAMFVDVKMEIDDESIADVVSTRLINQDSMVSCGRCGESMSYAEYKNEHRHKHYNLCWLDGEKKLDYSDLSNIVTLLREILPKNAERNKKVSYTCEWCKDNKKSVVGYASHVKKCAPEQKVLSPCKEPIEETVDLNVQDLNVQDSMVTCGSCQGSMTLTEYEEKHKSTHYNLCWLNSEEKPDFDNENVITRLLKQTLPKYAAVHKKVNFSCEWCKSVKKSVPGFANHIKKCKLRPDKICLSNETILTNDTSIKSDAGIAKDKLESIVTCGRCNTEMTFKEYCYAHCSTHYNLCWIDGEEKPDFDNYDTVISKLKECIPFSAARRRNVSLTCEYCKTVKKSVVGFASHIIFCNKNPDDISSLLVKCEDCGCKVKPSTLGVHKAKSCKGLTKTENKNDSFNNRSHQNNSGSCHKLRRKKRPPNVLTFHPDTKHVSEYYDWLCRLCDYIASRVDDILNHILTIHSININNIKNDFNLNDYILNTYEVHKNIYLKPLLNYYNFSKKNFWIDYYHDDFQCDTILLNSNDAMKYLPSVQHSCKIYNSDDEQISIDLFKSIYIDGFYWLFTGGPIWAMSWCPVPHEVQTQYLAISCHPKPDMVHKQMTIYKYPSLLQLWTFNSLNNINNKSNCDMPYMCYGLAHEFGAVWDMAWCPSGAYELNKKIGLLALSTSSGDCPIFAMPYVHGNSEMFYIYKAKSVIARNFQCKWNEIGVQCTKVCWKTVPPFNTVICGYSNGMVSVFNINFKSIFLNNDVLHPSHTFRASKCNITGLSVNYFNSSILATTASDGNVILWDLNCTKNPVFKRKCYCPSNCDWLQQCYVLLYCTKGANPLFTKVRTINFSNYDNDVCGYNPELYVLKNVANSTKVISNYLVNNDKTCNADETMNGSDINIDETSTTLNDFNIDSDDESLKSVELSENGDEEKSEDRSKNIDDDDLFGPSFFQSSIHWSISGSNWMNIIATCDENGVIYEKLFLPETNQIPKENSTTFQLMIKKFLSNDASQSPYSNGYRFKETIKEFGLKLRTILPSENEQVQNSSHDDKPLLRYPLDNITKVSWNQNFCSFRWLAIGTQNGFALISPSQSISDDCIESFYKIVSTSNLNNSDCQA